MNTETGVKNANQYEGTYSTNNYPVTDNNNTQLYHQQPQPQPQPALYNQHTPIYIPPNHMSVNTQPTYVNNEPTNVSQYNAVHKQMDPNYEYPQYVSNNPIQTTTTTTTSTNVTILPEDESQTHMLLLILGFFFHILWPINFFISRNKIEKSKKYGNISCGLCLGFSCLWVLIIIVVIVIPIVVNFTVYRNYYY